MPFIPTIYKEEHPPFRQPAVGHSLLDRLAVGTPPIAIVFGSPFATDVPFGRDRAAWTSHVQGTERLELPVPVRFPLPEFELVLTDPPTYPLVQFLELAITCVESEVSHPPPGVQVQLA